MVGHKKSNIRSAKENVNISNKEQNKLKFGLCTFFENAIELHQIKVFKIQLLIFVVRFYVSFKITNGIGIQQRTAFSQPANFSLSIGINDICKLFNGTNFKIEVNYIELHIVVDNLEEGIEILKSIHQKLFKR